VKEGSLSPPTMPSAARGGAGRSSTWSSTLAASRCRPYLAGQAHESRLLELALEAVRVRRPGRGRSRRLAGDKGYSYRWIRCYLLTFRTSF
jgi:hypothetical protein